jgi:4a-hydroxytetrahydrobiopterin dehydratase
MLHSHLPEWDLREYDGVPRLVRRFRFPDFAGAMAFAVDVGAAAEAQDHHPRLVVEWGAVTVSWWTHKIRGLHRNDFIMAARTDAIAAKGPAGEP